MLINKITQTSVGADLSRTPPIYRPFVAYSAIPINLLNHIIGSYTTFLTLVCLQLFHTPPPATCTDLDRDA